MYDVRCFRHTNGGHGNDSGRSERRSHRYGYSLSISMEQTRPGSLTHVIVEVFGAQINGPIRIAMTLLTTNEIAELVEFYG